MTLQPLMGLTVSCMGSRGYHKRGSKVKYVVRSVKDSQAKENALDVALDYTDDVGVLLKSTSTSVPTELSENEIKKLLGTLLGEFETKSDAKSYLESIIGIPQPK